MTVSLEVKLLGYNMVCHCGFNCKAQQTKEDSIFLYLFGFPLCEAPLHALFPTFSTDVNFLLIDFSGFRFLY